MPIRVVVSGTGKMGRQVLMAVCAEPGLEPAGVLSRIAGEEYLSLPDGSGLVPFGAEPAALFPPTRPHVVVAFTNTERQTIEGTRGGVLDGITIHSVRLPGLVAHQEVIFGAPGQTLIIRHDSTSRESFMPGVLLAIEDGMKREKLGRGLE